MIEIQKKIVVYAARKEQIHSFQTLLFS
jgi:hypothetical protein